MIRGPVQPMTRDGLMQLLRERADLLEHGLRIVSEAIDCSRGVLGPIDALARDAGGAPVLLFVAEPHDEVLVPRVLAAHRFVERNGASLARAMPEVDVRFGQPFRCFVVGADLDSDLIEAMSRLRLPNLEIYELELFLVGAQERCVVRSRTPAIGPVPTLDAAVPAVARTIWDAIVSLVTRIDPAIHLDGDRFSRRATYRGRVLCEFWCVDDHVFASLPGTTPRLMQDGDDLRQFGDQAMRRFLALLSERDALVGSMLARSELGAGTSTAAAGRDLSLATLRASLSASRLSREEYSALGEPAMPEEVQKEH